MTRDTTSLNPPHLAAARRPVHIQYQLRVSDLYWMWETSYVGLATTLVFLVLGLTLLSAAISPGDKPVGIDIAMGLVSLVLAPVLAPGLLIFLISMSAQRGREIQLTIDEHGLAGWPVPGFRQTSWARLRHPRLERRVLVLPFSWPFADSWAVIPARAFTPDQFAAVMAIMESHGHLRDGNRQSPMGRLLGLLDGHARFSRAVPPSPYLSAFPTFHERLVRAGAPVPPLRPWGGSPGVMARRLLVLGGFAMVALASMTTPPDTVPVRERHLTNLVGNAGLAVITLGVAAYAQSWRRIPRAARFALVALLSLLAALLAASALASIA